MLIFKTKWFCAMHGENESWITAWLTPSIGRNKGLWTPIRVEESSSRGSHEQERGAQAAIGS